MHVRHAVESDLDAMVDLLEEVAAERIHIGTEMPVDRSERRERFARSLREGHINLVAEQDDAVVGILGLKEFGGLFDLGMMIRAQWRGKGAGRALLTAAIEAATRAGGHKITLQVWPHNHAAIALYESAGFEREGYQRGHWKRREGEIWDVILMGLRLGEPAGDEPRS